VNCVTTRTITCLAATGVMIAGMLMPPGALACESPDNKMKTNELGFIFKVVGGSDKVEAKKASNFVETAFMLELLFPYSVICEEGPFYKITDLQAETASEAETGNVGYVLKEQVYPVPTREAVGIVTFDRDFPIVAWDDEQEFWKFVETGKWTVAQPALKLAFNEDAVRPKRELGKHPYPVLSRKSAYWSGRRPYLRMLLPVALPPEGKVIDESDYRGYPTILLAARDGGKLNQLRNIAAKFNIDLIKGGILIQEGYVFEGLDLFDPVIWIDKKTLDDLIHLLKLFGATGVDLQVMKETAAHTVAAIGGASYDPNESMEALIKKRLGLQFRTRLLEFNPEFLAGMNQKERQEMIERIPKQAAVLAEFLKANLEAFNKQPAVWMPMSLLP
jgi:hypothetical protein